MIEDNDRLDYLLEDPSPLLGEVGTRNVVATLRHVRDTTTDPHEAVKRARFALRALGASLNPWQADPLTVASVAGYMFAPTMPFCTALTATGPWGNETGAEKLRAYLAMVLRGQHPAELADMIGMDEDEYRTLNDLLALEYHWEDTIGDRVFLAVMDGASLKEVQQLARCNRRRAREWRAWVRQTLQDLNRDFEKLRRVRP